MKELINALQLCIKTAIASHRVAGKDTLLLKFHSIPKNDKGFEYFRKLFGSNWDEKERLLTIRNFSALLSPAVINFLMLSRLRDENMKALAKLDPQYRPFVQKILGDYQENPIGNVESIQQAVAIIFSSVEKQKITLRELSQRSGLSQVALSNFKTGNDVRLSSLIKILKALKLTLTID